MIFESRGGRCWRQEPASPSHLSTKAAASGKLSEFLNAYCWSRPRTRARPHGTEKTTTGIRGTRAHSPSVSGTRAPGLVAGMSALVRSGTRSPPQSQCRRLFQPYCVSSERRLLAYYAATISERLSPPPPCETYRSCPRNHSACRRRQSGTISSPFQVREETTTDINARFCKKCTSSVPNWRSIGSQFLLYIRVCLEMEDSSG
jgi:hypothetical protein